MLYKDSARLMALSVSGEQANPTNLASDNQERLQEETNLIKHSNKKVKIIEGATKGTRGDANVEDGNVKPKRKSSYRDTLLGTNRADATMEEAMDRDNKCFKKDSNKDEDDDDDECPAI